MSRSFEITGRSLVTAFYAVTLVGLVLLLGQVVWPLDEAGEVALVLLLALLLLAGVVGVWRRRTGREGDHLGTAEDIAYDPVAYPGQAAKERWAKAVRRLPGSDDDEE